MAEMLGQKEEKKEKEISELKQEIRRLKGKEKEDQKKAYYIKKRQNNCSWFIEGYKLLTDSEYNDLVKWRNENIAHYEEYKIKKVSIKKYNNHKEMQLN